MTEGSKIVLLSIPVYSHYVRDSSASPQNDELTLRKITHDFLPILVSKKSLVFIFSFSYKYKINKLSYLNRHNQAEVIVLAVRSEQCCRQASAKSYFHFFRFHNF